MCGVSAALFQVHAFSWTDTAGNVEYQAIGGKGPRELLDSAEDSFEKRRERLSAH